MPPEFAPIELEPAAEHCAWPAAFGPFAIVATLAADELQWLFRVTSCELLSLNVPIAENCSVLPALQLAGLGETASDTRVPVPTVRLVVPATPDAEAEIVSDPAFLPWAMPVERIEARFGFEDFHVIPARLLAVLPSLKVPVAENLIDVRTAIRGFAGFIAMLTSCALETVSPVDPAIEPKVAVMVALPVLELVASPEPLIATAAGFEELHTTELETSCVLLSLKVPTASNCLVVPIAMVEFAGVTLIDIRVAPVTVSEAFPLTEPLVAVIVVVPRVKLVATPFVSTEATELDDEDQVTEVNGCVLPSSKLPVALNCCVVPSAIDGLAGVREIESRCAGTTVRTVLSVNGPTVAVIVVEPAATVVASPFELTVATSVADELHVTPLLRSALEPSL